MSFTNRLATIVPGFGSPYANDTLFLSQAISLSTTSAVNYGVSGLTPTVSRGYIRAKIYGAGGTSPTVVLMDTVVTDGTTYVELQRYNPTTALVMSTSAAAGSPYTNGGSAGPPVVPGGMEFLIPFLVDINVNQLIQAITLGGTTPTAKLDLELSGVS